MPTDKKKARTEAKNKKGGARRVKASVKVGDAATKSSARSTNSSKNPRARAKAAIRTQTRNQTASNLESTGKAQMTSGVKKTRAKDQIVTPRSAHKKELEKYGKSYGGMSKRWRQDLPSRKRKKGQV